MIRKVDIWTPILKSYLEIGAKNICDIKYECSLDLPLEQS